MDHHVVWLKENLIKEDHAMLRVIECGTIIVILRLDLIGIGSNGSTMDIKFHLYSNEDSLHLSTFMDWRELHKTLFHHKVPTDYCGDIARFGLKIELCSSESASARSQRGETVRSAR